MSLLRRLRTRPRLCTRRLPRAQSGRTPPVLDAGRGGEAGMTTTGADVEARMMPAGVRAARAAAGRVGADVPRGFGLCAGCVRKWRRRGEDGGGRAIHSEVAKQIKHRENERFRCNRVVGTKSDVALSFMSQSVMCQGRREKKGKS